MDPLTLALMKRRQANLGDVPSLEPRPESVPRTSIVDALRGFSAGAGHGITNNLEGLYQLATDPMAGTEMLEGLWQAGKHPKQTAAALAAYMRAGASSPSGAGQMIGELLDPNMLRSVGRIAGKPMMSEMTAYHGSPHKFDKFDSTKIGTGEGAQAYGHGLYFAENPDVAKGYSSMGTHFVTLNGKKVDARTTMLNYSDGATEAERLAANALWRFRGDKKAALESIDLPSKMPHEKEAVMLLKNGKLEIEKGSLYNVDIPDEHINKMLDWDAPLSEQPEAIRKALAGIDLGPVELRDGMDLAGGGKLRINAKPPHPYALEMGGGLYSLTEADVRRLVGDGQQGMSLYQKLSAKLGGDSAASAKLKELGIPGIKYYDGGSRTAKKGTRNFVIFDDTIPKILDRK